MARLKIAYIGGGSTRAAGTMASFVEQGANFAGSEIVLIDLDSERLELIRGLAERMAAAKSLDLTVSATTDRRAGLDGCDAILTSYRPGGFQARVLDERSPFGVDRYVVRTGRVPTRSVATSSSRPSAASLRRA